MQHMSYNGWLICMMKCISSKLNIGCLEAAFSLFLAYYYVFFCIHSKTCWFDRYWVMIFLYIYCYKIISQFLIKQKGKKVVTGFHTKPLPVGSSSFPRSCKNTNFI